MSELPDPVGDLDLGNPNATAWNRAACGLFDAPSEVELSALDVLAIAHAEAVVQREFIRWCGLDTDGD